jgi:hypothetical protein
MIFNIIVTDFQHHCMFDVIVLYLVNNFNSLDNYVRLTIHLLLIVKTNYSIACLMYSVLRDLFTLDCYT